MSYLGATVIGIAGAGAGVRAGAGVLTGIAAMKNALMGGDLIAEGMTKGITTMKVGARGIGV